MSLTRGRWTEDARLAWLSVAAIAGAAAIKVAYSAYEVYRMMDPAAKRELLHDRNPERKKVTHTTRRDPYERVDDPTYHGLAPFSTRNVYAETDGGVQMHGYHVIVFSELRKGKPTEPFGDDQFENALKQRPTVLFFHGTGYTVAAPHRIKLYSLIAMRLDCNVVAFDYRGYGLSPGVPTERSVYTDARAAFDWLRAVLMRVAPERKLEEAIAVVGHSLGGPIGSHLVKQLQDERIKVRAFACLATFRNMPDLIKEILIEDWQAIATKASWFGMKDRYLSTWTERFDLEDRLKTISCPTLIVHTTGEEVIHHSHYPALVKSASSIRDFAKEETVVVDGKYTIRYIPGTEQVDRLIGWEGPAFDHGDCIGAEVVVDMIGEILNL